MNRSTCPIWSYHCYQARVYIDQCRARINNPSQRSWRFTLLEWAAKRRLQALCSIRNARMPLPKEPGAQLDLF